MLRLRSAGFGVVLAGVLIGILGAVISFQLAASTIVLIAVGGAIVSPLENTWLVQLYLGIISVGVLGFIEASTSVGFGFGAAEFAMIAVLFGLVDIVVGSAMHWLQSR